MAVPKRLRFEVLRRDGHTCRYCGGSAPDVHLTVDHVIPVSLGGRDEAGNLVTACRDCNAGKSSMSPDQAQVDEVSERALRWRDALELAAERIAAEDQQVRAEIEAFHIAWHRWSRDGLVVPLPPDHNQTLENLVRSGLDGRDLAEAVDIAMRGHNVEDTFRYFAGICWRRIERLQNEAMQILEGEA